MFRKSILVANNEMRLLLSVIKSNYISDNKNALQEVNKNCVANRIDNENIKSYVINCWDNLEDKIGFEVTLLENNCKRSIINRLYNRSRDLNFVIKTKSDVVSKELQDKIKKTSNINIIMKEFVL